MCDGTMNPFRSILLLLAVVSSPVRAETMRFEDAAGLLGASCAKDIDTNCRGVNLDPGRLKECLARNQDSVSVQCKTDSVRAFDAIQKRVAARSAVAKMCDRDALKSCGGAQKDGVKTLQCLLATRGVTARCNQAIGEAGYR
jgi:hypothetical protein